MLSYLALTAQIHSWAQTHCSDQHPLTLGKQNDTSC